MANPNQDLGGSKKPRSSFLPDPAKINSARRPTTLNLTNEINPAPVVPGQSTFPASYIPPRDPRSRGISFSSLSNNRDLVQKDTAISDITRLRKKLMSSTSGSSHTLGASPEASDNEATAPATDNSDHTVGEEEESHLYDSDNTEDNKNKDDPSVLSDNGNEDETSTDGSIHNAVFDPDNTSEEDEPLVRKKAKIVSDSDGSDNDERAKPKRTAAAKKAGKRVAKRKTPSTSAQETGMNVRPQPFEIPKRNMGRRLPKIRAEADKADTMMLEWKESGTKSWDAIDRRWCEMTGELPGAANLPVRYLLLKRIFAQNEGTVNTEALKRAKALAEEKLETFRWNIVSEYYYDQEHVKIAGRKLRTKWYEMEGEEEPEAPEFEDEESSDDEDGENDDDE